jgi:hypothetical protein
MALRNTPRLLMILLWLCVVAAERPFGAQQHPDQDSTPLDLALAQNDAPVALRGYLASAGTFLYETAKVENISAKPIAAVTFGVLVADPSKRKLATLLRSSVEEVSLLPGKRQDVNVRLLSVSELDDLKHSLSRTPKVTLGVIGVEWADGTKWVFRLPDDAIDFSIGTGLIVAAADQGVLR